MGGWGAGGICTAWCVDNASIQWAVVQAQHLPMSTTATGPCYVNGSNRRPSGADWHIRHGTHRIRGVHQALCSMATRWLHFNSYDDYFCFLTKSWGRGVGIDGYQIMWSTIVVFACVLCLVARDGENWLAPGGGGGGSRTSPEGGGGGWEMDTCDRTHVWSSLSAFLF